MGGNERDKKQNREITIFYYNFIAVFFPNENLLCCRNNCYISTSAL